MPSHSSNTAAIGTTLSLHLQEVRQPPSVLLRPGHARGETTLTFRANLTLTAGASSRPHLTRLVTAATTSSSSSDEAYYSYSSDSGRPLHYILPSSSPATAQEQGQAGSDTGLGFAGYADSSFHQQEKREQQQQQQQQQQQYTPDRAAPSSYLDSPLFALPRPSPTTAGHTSDSSYSSEVETNPLLRQNLHLNGRSGYLRTLLTGPI